MLVITFGAAGYSENQTISEHLFRAVGNTIVRVKCDPPFYGTPRTLMDNICSYMTGFMPNGCIVKTYHVISNQSSGCDANGSYISKIDFQVFI